MRTLIKWATGTYKGSNYISYILRKQIERVNFRKLIGLNLTSTMLFAGVFLPYIDTISSKVKADQFTNVSLVAENTQTNTNYFWPVANYALSQGYKTYHPAIDLSGPYDEAVTAIADGTVQNASYSQWGYGRNIILKHDDGYLSLYAHLSKILINTGDRVSKGTVIGNLGSSGWATGPHLHLEIIGPEGNVNPIDVLPAIPTPASS